MEVRPHTTSSLAAAQNTTWVEAHPLCLTPLGISPVPGENSTGYDRTNAAEDPRWTP